MGFTKEEIGAIFKKLRIDTGMTQREVGARLGRKQQIVGHWETGYAQPDLDTFFQLCTLYQADINNAFGDSKPNQSSFTMEEVDLVMAHRIATSDEHALIGMILKKYMGGTAMALLSELYTAPADRWLPDSEPVVR